MLEFVRLLVSLWFRWDGSTSYIPHFSFHNSTSAYKYIIPDRPPGRQVVSHHFRIERVQLVLALFECSCRIAAGRCSWIVFIVVFMDWFDCGAQLALASGVGGVGWTDFDAVCLPSRRTPACTLASASVSQLLVVMVDAVALIEAHTMMIRRFVKRTGTCSQTLHPVWTMTTAQAASTALPTL